MEQSKAAGPQAQMVCFRKLQQSQSDRRVNFSQYRKWSFLRAHQLKPSVLPPYPRYSAAHTMRAFQGAPSAPEASQTPVLASELMTLWSSTTHGHTSSLLGLTQPEPQKHTSGLGVISFIVILVVVVIVLVSVVSLRFKCRKNKESEDPQKPGSSGISERLEQAANVRDSQVKYSLLSPPPQSHRKKECTEKERGK
ncbi:hypothetical protein J0S82_000802 [Galemys pyrenaicus]|uniref:Endothelial cell-specific chemotaxis regulator n=1 Tax=Galemys pyrenaicus TaxID=202257 RepID=A0A8J5ZXG6_GALPY|nr:hypothetical protein J0S82_000802 [Galemys pyrenaicus]